MVKLNKYLRELGINEENWLFDKDTIETDSRYQEDEEGFKDAEFFSLDYSLSLYIYSQLCYFREYCLYGYSGWFHKRYKDRAIDKWKEILDDMIEAFKLLIIEDESRKEFDREKRNCMSKNRRKKINKGMRYFIKYYHDLWY